jgi:hypothetical protein
MVAMNHKITAGRRRPDGPPPRRKAELAVTLAGAAVLAAACGGAGAHPAGSAASPGPAQQLAIFAKCMRSHGTADFYFSRQVGTLSPPAPGQLVMDRHGYTVRVDDSPQLRAAQQACQHLLPGSPPSAGDLHRQFLSALKAAACMRSHGYPDWPDPQQQDGRNFQPRPPTGVDTSSPRFQSAAKGCGVGPLAPP